MIKSLVTVTLVSFLFACTATDDAETIVESAEGQAPADLKADHVNVTFRVLDVDVGEAGDDETRVVLRSRAAYVAYFGQVPPADVDFTRDWVFFYSAGVRSTGGFSASLDSITRSHSGKTLYFSTHLTSPGAGCVVTFALTKPSVVVAFRRPAPTPTILRAYHADEETSCGGEDAIGGLGDACGSRGLAPCGEGLYCNFSEAAACGELDHGGTCAEAPGGCLQVWTPVCGCDGVTYSNECTANAAEVSVRHSGPCS